MTRGPVYWLGGRQSAWLTPPLQRESVEAVGSGAGERARTEGSTYSAFGEPPPGAARPPRPHGPENRDSPAEFLRGDGHLELEIGYGKGRYLLAQALAHPERRYVGIEVVSKYYRRMVDRAGSRGVRNLLNIKAEALSFLATLLPRGFADRLHVYFPDPWPKSRHRRWRLFDADTVDLVLGVLRPGGELCFATDFLEYGESVATLLATYPGLQLERQEGPWPEGARTNYEAKFIEEGRPILRLRGRLAADAENGALHPAGRDAILAAWAGKGLKGQ